MPAPASYEYSAAAQVAAQTSFVDLIDAFTPDAGYVALKDSGDVMLSVLPLDMPCGTVNGTTGQLTLAFDGRDEEAAASGTVAYAEVCDGNGDVHLVMPVQAGSVAVSGKLVMNTLTVVMGAPVEAIAATIG